MFVSETLSWSSAQAYCENINGRLAEPRTLKEYLFVRSIWEDFGSGIHMWLGGSKTQNEGRYVWLTDSQPVENEAFNVWAEGEPNNYKGNEDCLEFSHHEASSLGFNDRDCDFSQKFVCEILHTACDNRCV